MNTARLVGRSVLPSLLCALSATASAADPPNPILHWCFDDPANPGYDCSGAGHDLTIPGSWASVPGAGGVGKAITFEHYDLNGPDDPNLTSASWGAQTSTSGLAYPGPNGFAATFWARLDGGTDPGIQDYWPHRACGQKFSIFYSSVSEEISFYLRHDFGEQTTIYADVAGYAGHWVHVAGVYEPAGHTMKLYVNGQLQAEGDLEAPMREETAPYLYTCGSWHGTSDATVDEVRVYDQALSATDVRQLACPVPSDGLIWSPTNGHLYEFVTAELEWEDARGVAEQSGGYLATITSEAESAFICSCVIPAQVTVDAAWIGGYQPPGSAEPDGGWTWVTGEEWDYAEWCPGEPNNVGGEDYLDLVLGTGDCCWNDEDNARAYYIVEYGVDCNGNGVSDNCDIDCGPPGSVCDIPGCGQNSDCQPNGIPDECDIAQGASSDCDVDGRPDECQPDCDEDAIPDVCDPDIDDDGVPNGRDVCYCTPVAVDTEGRPVGDFDLDCDTDLRDYQLFRQGFTGAGE